MVSQPGRRPRVREVFVGPRLRAPTSHWLRLRSTLWLAVLSVLIGAVVAAVLASAIGFGVQALLHAVGGGS